MGTTELKTRDDAPPVPVEMNATNLAGAIMRQLDEGKSIGEMERALDLAERLLDRERDAATAAAFARVQSEVSERPVPRSGEYKDPQGGPGFRYATAADYVQHCVPALKREGFAFTASQPDESTFELTLIHSSGGRVSTRVPFVQGRANKMASEQMVARGGITNAQRRAWAQIFGLVEGDGPPTVAAAEPISADQCTELNDLADEYEKKVPGGRRRFLKAYGVQHMDELRITRYTAARDDLKRRLGQ